MSGPEIVISGSFAKAIDPSGIAVMVSVSFNSVK